MKRYPVRTGHERELFPELVDVLLEGWGCPTRPDSPDPFRIFDLSTGDFARLWRKHRPALMKEAQRRGIPKPMGLEFDTAYLNGHGHR